MFLKKSIWCGSFLLLSNQVAAVDKFWVCADDVWDNGGCWSLTPGGAGGAGQPLSSDSAILQTSGTDTTVTYQNMLLPNPSLIRLELSGLNGASMKMIQSQDTLAVDFFRLGMLNNSIAEYEQNGGIVNAGTLTVANGNDSQGTYRLSGGTLTTSATQISDVGKFSPGLGAFEQTGGTHQADVINVGTGSSYTLTDGVVSADALAGGGTLFQGGGSFTATNVASIGSMTLTAGDFSVGGNLTGGLIQIGSGAITVGGSFSGGLTIDGGSVTVGGDYSGGAVSSVQKGGNASVAGDLSGLYQLDDGVLTTGSVGLNGPTTLTQGGGNHTVVGDLSGVYELDGGILSSSTVGANGATLITQTGGTYTVTGNSNADYALSGDADLTVGGNSSGNLTVAGGAAIINGGHSGATTVGGTGSISVAGNSTGSIDMTGGIMSVGGQVSSSAIDVSGATLGVGNAVVTDELRLNGAVVTAGSAITSGALQVTGDSQINADIALQVQSQNSINARLTVNGLLTAGGTNTGGTGTLVLNSGMTGRGTVAVDVENAGTLQAKSGNLVIAGNSFTNSGLLANSVGSNLFVESATVSHNGSIQANAAGSVVFDSVITNANGQTITLNGGTVSSPSLTNALTGSVTGAGTISGNLNNAGSIDLFGASQVFGDVSNQSTGNIKVENDALLISGHTTNEGTIETLNGEVIFAGGLTNNGALLFDPSTLTITTLSVGVDGYLSETGDPGDRIIISEDFENQSQRNTDWQTAHTIFQFNGGSRDAANPQLLEAASADLGSQLTPEIIANNFVLGLLEIGTSDTYVKLADEHDNSAVCLSSFCEIWGNEALYVDDLVLSEGATLDLMGFNLYFLGDFIDGGGTIINGSVSAATVVPIPAAVWLFVSGVLGILGFSARNVRRR